MLFWNEYKTGDIRKYKIAGELMQMSAIVSFCLLHAPTTFKSFCNGVGSKVGFWNKLFYHFIPNFIGLINITGASDLHDVAFSLPKVFDTLEDAYEYFEQANYDFLSNLRRLIENGTHIHWVRKARYFIATQYYYAVSSSLGWKSFMSGKTIGGRILSTDEITEFYNQRNPKLEE